MRFADGTLLGCVIAVVEKRKLSPVPKLRHVMRHLRDHDACQSSHPRKLPNHASTVNNRYCVPSPDFKNNLQWFATELAATKKLLGTGGKGRSMIIITGRNAGNLTDQYSLLGSLARMTKSIIVAAMGFTTGTVNAKTVSVTKYLQGHGEMDLFGYLGSLPGWNEQAVANAKMKADDSLDNRWREFDP
jgi:hypothetical protein